MKTTSLSLFILFVLVISGCNRPNEAVNSAAEPVTITENKTWQEQNKSVDALNLEFLEQEEGIDPYHVRMLVTPEFLRMDEGKDSDNFLLFDRQAKNIYSVTHHDKRILKIPHRENIIRQESTLDLGITENNVENMPVFAGKKPQHLTFTANKKTCYDVITVDVLPEAVQAMREYLMTLAGEQIANLNKTPVEMRSDCMLANLIYEPVRHLDYGFPLREWDYKGYVRELVNFKTEAVKPDLFKLDSSYTVLQLGDTGLDFISDE